MGDTSWEEVGGAMGRKGQVLGKGGSGRGATGYRSLNPDPIRKGTDFCHQLLLGSMVWSNSVGLTDHPYILSESQREPCEPLGLGISGGGRSAQRLPGFI